MQEQSHGSQGRFLSSHSNLLYSQSSKSGRSQFLDLGKAILWANNDTDWRT